MRVGIANVTSAPMIGRAASAVAARAHLADADPVGSNNAARAAGEDP